MHDMHTAKVLKKIKKIKIWEKQAHSRLRRYLLERSDFEAAKPLLLHALELSSGDDEHDSSGGHHGNHAQMTEIRADVLFSLSSLSAEVGQDIETNLGYAQHHFELREKLRDGTPFGEARMAMAYGELAYAQLLAGRYEDAVHHSQIAINMTEESDDFKRGADFPTFASSHQAMALAALERHDDAMGRIQKALEYWNSHSSERFSFQ
jgi:tetratricopeptide (TPR) repeat protein